MPCQSDYMNPTRYELELSRVMTLIDELAGKGFDQRNFRGYHPDVYQSTITRERLDEYTAALCERIQRIDPKEYSLELQMWWRDHREADRRRMREAIARLERDEAKREALAKLTDYEKELLGL